jgi:hypothetical protein
MGNKKLLGGKNMITGQGKKEITENGGSRESNNGRGRFDLLPYEAIEELAKWYEEATGKYPERDWEKGLSVKDCINRMIRHSIKAGNGWTDEDHLAAVMWNAAAAITMIKRRPDCNDHHWKDSVDELKQIVNSVYGGKSATTTIVDEEAFKCPASDDNGMANPDTILKSESERA